MVLMDSAFNIFNTRHTKKILLLLGEWSNRTLGKIDHLHPEVIIGYLLYWRVTCEQIQIVLDGNKWKLQECCLVVLKYSIQFLYCYYQVAREELA